MFDIGLPEIAITGIVALVVLGPKELPGLLRLAGQLTRKAKNMAHEFRMSLDDMVEVDELEEFRREAWKKATITEKPLAPKAIEADASPLPINADISTKADTSQPDTSTADPNKGPNAV